MPGMVERFRYYQGVHHVKHTRDMLHVAISITQKSIE